MKVTAVQRLQNALCAGCIGASCIAGHSMAGGTALHTKGNWPGKALAA
jgi:S-formylglutathione hydrolase FrmB